MADNRMYLICKPCRESHEPHFACYLAKSFSGWGIGDGNLAAFIEAHSHAEYAGHGTDEIFTLSYESGPLLSPVK